MRTATMLLAVVVVLTAAPAWADFKAGAKAYLRGDYATALKEWRPLAEQGDARAQFKLAGMYFSGRGVPQNNKEAIRWYRLAAELGHPKAQSSMGFLYANGKIVPQDYKEALRWYRLAAEQGVATAQGDMGVIYQYGRGVPQDNVQAHMWYNLAAARGYDRARRARDKLAKEMTSAQIADAQQLALEWTPKSK